MELITLLAINAAFVLACVLALWLLSIALHDVSIIDMIFALIVLGISVVSFVVASGVPVRKCLLTGMVGIWALRITWHLVQRNLGHGEDSRYTKLRSWVPEGWPFYWLSLKRVFLLQGLVFWLVSLPVQVGQFYREPAGLGIMAWLGMAVWLLGLVWEAVADAQLKAFKADPANAGNVMSRGLWRYSRHPNYFGELAVWWGIFLVACDNPWALFTVIGPAAYTYLVVNVTGKATLEKRMLKRNADYRDYVETTSAIIPLPPHRRG